MNIPVEGNYRNLISETLLNIRRRQAQVKALTEELEAIALSAASFQNVDLAEFHLDVDKLQFIPRAQPPQPELVEVKTDGEYPYLGDPNHVVSPELVVDGYEDHTALVDPIFAE